MTTLLRMAAVAFVAVACGCANKMALQPDMKSLDTSKKSVAIFTLRTVNEHKPGFQTPGLKLHVIAAKDGKDTTFQFDKPCREEKDAFFEQLVSIDLEPGSYRLGTVEGGNASFWFAWGFSVPLEGAFDLPANSIVYLGHVVMINRERKGNEPRSGSPFPLVDQATSGYGNGTTEVRIVDRGQEDMAAFQKTYPCLAGITVQKMVLKK